MRIIAGEAGGRKLTAPAGDGTRPTSDRLRESLFSILGDSVAGARVLDLFGGSGALALEALSRGAKSAVIADKDRSALAAIQKNAAAVCGENWRARVKILRGDYRAVIRDLSGEVFDLVFLDPPYRMEEAYPDALERLRGGGHLAPNALMVLEHGLEREMALPEGFETADFRRYGTATLQMAREEGLAE